MKPIKAAATVVFARNQNKTYVFSAQRANTKKWDREILFGAAGKAKIGEKTEMALYRELWEELGLKKKEITRVTYYGKQKPEIPEHKNTSGNFYFVEIPFNVLERIVSEINKNPQKFPEHRNARINRIGTIGKKPKLLQPHYKSMLPKITKRLWKEHMTKAF